MHNHQTLTLFTGKDLLRRLEAFLIVEYSVSLLSETRHLPNISQTCAGMYYEDNSVVPLQSVAISQSIEANGSAPVLCEHVLCTDNPLDFRDNFLSEQLDSL